jgi:short-subunit dehydrogenase
VNIDQKQLVALVVGASSGVGRATAEALAKRGHTVFGSSRTRLRVNSPGITPVELEVGSEHSVNSAIQQVLKSASRIDVVIYSAGAYVAGAAEETSDELAIAQLETYFIGAHRVVRAILPTMREQRKGRLILMSSSAAVAAIPFHSPYSASKAALQHYADALRDEVAPFGVEVTCIEATSVRTGAVDAMSTDKPIRAYEPERTRVIDRFRQLQLDGHSPEPLAQAIVRAVESRKMPHVYRIGPRARLLPVLQAVLPRSVFRRLYGGFFGLSRAR